MNPIKKKFYQDEVELRFESHFFDSTRFDIIGVVTVTVVVGTTDVVDKTSSLSSLILVC